MNKSDKNLIIIVFTIVIIILGVMRIFENESEKEAFVYYKDEMVLKIDLSNTEYKSFSVVGDNGLVDIEVENGRVRVVNETSPLNICSKQGWVDSSYTPIVCLPNSVIIKIVEKDTFIDAVVN